MARACPDDQVRQALDSRVVKPKLKRLRMESARSLRVLLGCHARGKTGFYDGFINLEPLSLRAKNLTAPASAEANPHEAQSAEKDGTMLNSNPPSGSGQKLTAGITPKELYSVSAARVVEYVDMYYEVS